MAEQIQLPVNQWVLATAAMCCAGISSTYVQSWHYFVEPMRDHFDLTYKEAAVIPTMGLVFLYLSFLAYISALALNFRRAMLLAAFCCAGSQIAAAFVNHFPTVVLLMGLVNGFGSCLSYNLPLMFVAQVFPHETRNKALIIVHLGSGFFMALYPLVIGKLQQHFTLFESLLLMSGFALQLIPLALLVPACKPYAETEEISVKIEHQTLSEMFLTKLRAIFQWEILGTGRMIALCLASYLVASGSALVYSFAYSILTVQGELPHGTASALISACGAALLGGKCASMFFSGEKLKHWKVFTLAGLSQGFMILITGLMSKVGVIPATAALMITHVTFGLMFTIHSLIIVDLYPVEKFSLVFSYTVIAMMVACLSTPVISGWLVDLTCSFEVPLLIFGTAKILMFSIPTAYMVYLLLQDVRKSRKNSALLRLDDITPSSRKTLLV